MYLAGEVSVARTFAVAVARVTAMSLLAKAALRSGAI